MPGFRVGKSIYHNFGPFAHAEFDFSLPGLTVIEGQIEGFVGSDSNGSGKSFLFDGVSFAVFGKCTREDYAGDDVIRLCWKDNRWVDRGDGEGTWVDVTISNGTDTVSIRRHRKDPRFKDNVYLKLNGADVTRGTNPQTNEAIERILGMDFTAFVNSTAFGVRGDVKQFLAAADSDRKRVMEKLLGLEIYSEAQKLANVELRSVVPSMNELDSQRVRISATLSEQRAGLQRAKERDDGKLLADLNRARLKSAEARKALAKAAATETAAGKALAAAEESVAAKMQEWETATDAYDRKSTALSSALRDAEVAVGTASGKLPPLQSRIAKWNTVSGKTCTACDQKVDAKHAGHMKKMIEETIETVKVDLSAATTRADKARKDLKAHAANRPVRPDDSALEEAREAAHAATTARVRIAGEVTAADKVLESLRGQESSQKAHEDELAALVAASEQELAEVEVEWTKLRKRSDHLTFWVEGFGNSGVKSLLIESELPEINRRATGFAQRLLGPGSKIALSATKTLKTREVQREEMSVEVQIPRCTKKYGGASKGQKLRLDLSLILSCREILAERSAKAFDQFFADELFDGLDRTGSRFVVDLLQEIAAKHPVALISHDPRLKTAATRVVTVRWANGVASLLARGVEVAHTQPVRAKPAKKVVRG